MFPILQVGPLALQVPGLILLLGLWLGLSMSEKYAGKHDVHPELLYNLVFAALLAGIFGARLTFAGRFPGAFSGSPISLISLNPGLLDPVGGLVFAGIGALIYGQRKKLPFWPVLDALVPLFASLSIAIAFANLSSGKGFGAITSMPWGIELWGAVRHPSQVYEAAAGLFTLVFLWPLITRTSRRPAGYVFLLFLVLIAGIKLFLEGFRGDSLTLANGIRTIQVAAWVVLAYGLWALSRLRRQIKRKS